MLLTYTVDTVWIPRNMQVVSVCVYKVIEYRCRKVIVAEK